MTPLCYTCIVTIVAVGLRLTTSTIVPLTVAGAFRLGSLLLVNSGACALLGTPVFNAGIYLLVTDECLYRSVYE